MLRHVTDGEARYDHLLVWCPGCDDLHALPVTDTGGKRPQWTWDGSLEAPTLEPSILTKMSWVDKPDYVCHSYLRGGTWEFLADSTHALAGQHVPSPPLPEWVTGP